MEGGWNLFELIQEIGKKLFIRLTRRFREADALVSFDSSTAQYEP